MYQDKLDIVDEFHSAFGESYEEYLMHYGRSIDDGAPGPGSGRFPKGSGTNPFQHPETFVERYNQYKSEGMSEYEIAEAMRILNRKGQPSGTNLRTQLSIAKSEARTKTVLDAKRLLDEEGLSRKQVVERLGLKNESSLRSLLKEETMLKYQDLKGVAEFIKGEVDKYGMVDIGAGAEVSANLNLSKERLKQALYMLEVQGYPIWSGGMPQLTNPKQSTHLNCICKPGTPHSAIFDYEKIHPLDDTYMTRDGGATIEKKFNYPESMDSNRLAIRYAEDGGVLKDGLIEIRRGVPDLSLGTNHYAQVRILVDGTHYIKGMAKYSDDLPDGVDVMFNTNKTKDKSKMDVLKKIKDDPKNPFGASIKPIDEGGQYWYDSKTGKPWDPEHPVGKKKLGLINSCRNEGDWSDWKDALPSQFLSKQSNALAKQQLGIAKKDKQKEFDEIMALTNPTVKKKMLEDFADSCDYASVHLQAAAMPGQKYHVLLPVPALRDDECYCPTYKNGTKVALVRYPHGGTFEIPILTVNNNSKAGKASMGPEYLDAIGINHNNASRLSGADHDGDAAMVIPLTGKLTVKNTRELEGLKGFEPSDQYSTKKVDTGAKDPKTGEPIYKYYNKYGNPVKLMTEKYKQKQMGVASNLITDMTLKGAGPDDLAKAVKHSMVVIDAVKHELDFRSSEIENEIPRLKKEYQTGGASTIISRAKSQYSIPKTQGNPRINMKRNKNGELNPIYQEAEAEYRRIKNDPNATERMKKEAKERFNKSYDPKRPEGALIYKTADDLYYPEHKFNKETQLLEYKTTNGNTITYSPKDKKAVEKYAPVKKEDPKTGVVTFTNSNGDIQYRTKKRMQKSTKMAETDDANTLLSDRVKAPVMEKLYAEYANTMKRLGNEARKAYATTGKIEYSKKANLMYKKEVDALDEQLKVVKRNQPRERQANRLANSIVKAKTEANPNMTNEELKKIRQQEITSARNLYGAHRTTIKVSPRQWEAIQAGAISETKLKDILKNSDMDIIKQYATPRKNVKDINSSMQARIKRMRANDIPISEIAEQLNISTSTVSKYAK